MSKLGEQLLRILRDPIGAERFRTRGTSAESALPLDLALEHLGTRDAVLPAPVAVKVAGSSWIRCLPCNRFRAAGVPHVCSPVTKADTAGAQAVHGARRAQGRPWKAGMQADLREKAELRARAREERNARVRAAIRREPETPSKTLQARFRLSERTITRLRKEALS